MTSDQLSCLLEPQSVAVIGASDNIHKIGGRPILYMKRHGYRGRIYPINPQRKEVQSLPCYPSLDALPAVPDMVLIVVAGDQAVAAVDECARLGVRSVIVIASGFGEVSAEGRTTQQAMIARARANGMRLVGPNTQGLANFGNGAIASFSTMFLEVEPKDGPIGIVSQSGGMCAMTYGLLRQRGLGVRHVHATGNEADITVADLAWAVAHDPDVQLLLLYLESIANPAMLARTAEYARTRDLPIIAVKSGRTSSGQIAASSHTGALANEDRVVDAFLKHHGIWRVRDPHELALAAEVYLKGWRPRDRRLVIISNSGASCVMGADMSEEVGLPLARLSDTTRSRLAEHLPGFATTTNPVDITAALLSNSKLFSAVLPVVASDPMADLFLINLPVSGIGYDVDAFARDTSRFAMQTGKPVVVAAWQDNVAQAFRNAGVPTYANETEALRVLAQFTSHQSLMEKPRVQWPELPPPSSLPSKDGSLNEAQSLELLAGFGLPVVEHRLCHTATEVQEAFEAIDGSVVIKACSRDVPHKSEHGLVALNVASAEAAVREFTNQRKKLIDMGAAQEGVIVAAMRKGRQEFMVGARHDPIFGPLAVVGAGGTRVEALPDFALLMTPFDRADVLAALRGLRIAPLLDGVRGDPPLDVDALCDIVLATGRLIASAAGRIASIDVNPVLVGATGEGAVVVDALIELADQARDSAAPADAMESLEV